MPSMLTLTHDGSVCALAGVFDEMTLRNPLCRTIRELLLLLFSGNASLTNCVRRYRALSTCSWIIAPSGRPVNGAYWSEAAQRFVHDCGDEYVVG
eukprot:354442-Rhodomonas_salina.2